MPRLIAAVSLIAVALLLFILHFQLATSATSYHLKQEEHKIIKKRIQDRIQQQHQPHRFVCGEDKWQRHYTQHVVKPFLKKKPTKFIRYFCREHCYGLGDRIIGITVTFYMALLTNRYFILDWPEATLLWNPHSMDWSVSSSLQDLFSSLQKTGQEKKLLLNTTLRDETLRHAFMNMDIEKEVFEEKPLITFVTPNQRLMFNYIRKNPFLQRKMKELGLDRHFETEFNFVGCAYHYLFQATDAVLNSISDVLLQHSTLKQALLQYTQPLHWIGLQVRSGVGVGESLRPHQPSFFVSCANFFAQQILSSTSKRLVYFITTDLEDYKHVISQQLLQEITPQPILFHFPNKPVHIDQKQKNETLANELLVATVAEFTILSFMDDFAISRSNFGEVASYIGMKPRFKFPNRCLFGKDYPYFDYHMFDDDFYNYNDQVLDNEEE